VAEAKVLRKLAGHRGGVLAVAYSPGGDLIASGGSDCVLRLWDPATGKERLHVEQGDLRVFGIAFSPDGRTVAAAVENDRVRLYEATTGNEIPSPGGHRRGVNAVAVSPDGTTVATAGNDRTARLWDARTGKPLREFDGGGAVVAVAFSPDGRVVASASRSGAVRLWEAESGKNRLCEYPTVGGLGEGPLFTPDGKGLVFRHQSGSMVLWDLATGKRGRTFAESAGVDSPPLALSLNGKVLASCPGRRVGPRTSVVLWETGTGKERGRVAVPPELDEICSLALSPDGGLVAVGGPKGLLLWDVKGGRARATLEAPELGVGAVCFAPDGRTLASAGRRDRTVRVWEVATGQERVRFEGHQDAVNAVAFAPDGTRLLSGSDDSTVLAWDVLGPRPGRTERLTAKELGALWEALGKAEAGKALAVLRRFADAPEQAVPFLEKQIKPPAPPDAVRLARLPEDLDHDRFEVREKATAELENLGERAESALRRALADRPVVEVRMRLERLLGKLQEAPVSAERLRTLRALEVLEYTATPEARRLLRQLAEQGDGAWLTREADQALERLRRREN
jgi:WD40 repeat protein